MELSVYDVIKGPILSDKAQRINRDLKQLALEVHVAATKPMIRNALEKLFNVKVAEVRTAIRKYTPGRGVSRRRRVSVPTLKKMKLAYVTLAKGQSLSLFEQAGAPPAVEEKKESAGSNE